MASESSSEGVGGAGISGEGVLVIDDSPETVAIMCAQIRDLGLRPEGCASLEAALGRLHAGGIVLVLLDLLLPGVGGTEGVRKLRSHFPAVDVIVITGHPSVQAAVEAIQLGALDFLLKPIRPEHLEPIVRRAMSRRRLLVGGLEPPASADPVIVGGSPLLRLALETADKAAVTDIPVLIVGETGTGKELLARRIHAGSPRRDRPPVLLNCAAIPESLIERELFGNLRGAFTGADRTSGGLVQEAHGSTLVLDEVGDLCETGQAKILRVLEHGEVRSLGAVRTDHVDVRVVACTNRLLLVTDQQRPFRADLYHRLGGVVIEIPPLRARPEDLPHLALHFLAENRHVNPGITGLEPEALDALLQWRWPGNARELRNVVREAMLFATGERLCAEDLTRGFRRAASAAGPAWARPAEAGGGGGGGPPRPPFTTTSDCPFWLRSKTPQASRASRQSRSACPGRASTD
jgi:DNA-binding NtrC family response regulator